MSRPVDWSPLATADPVPGDPLEVASIGGQLTNVAAQIHADVTWLQSLCTAQFWDSGAGQAFQGQVDDAAAKLAKAHERYLAAGQALGTSPVAPRGTRRHSTRPRPCPCEPSPRPRGPGP